MRWIVAIFVTMFSVNLALIGGAKFVGYVHPNGGVIAYTVTNSQLDSFVMVTDIQTGQTIELTSHAADYAEDATGRTPEWSLDGERVSFWVYQNRTETTAYELNISNYSLNNLTEQTDFFSLPIYGQNEQYLYASLPTFLNVPMYLVNEDHPDGVRLANNVMSAPTWSPDGEYVAYINLYEELETDAGPSSGNAFQEIDIYIVELATLITRNYTLDHQTSGVPVWSPDGSRIIFVNRDRDIGQISMLDPETGDITSLPETVRATGAIPVWSPDSRYIAYAVAGEIYIVDMETYETQNMTETITWYDSEPVWSPDGQQIAYVSLRDGQQDIYVTQIETGNTRRITFSREIESDLAWRPR